MMLVRSGNRFIAVATVLDVEDGCGRAARWKAVATMEVASKRNGVVQRKDINVSFWNAKDLSRPQMADRARKLIKGEKILALIAADESEYSCLAFVRKEGVLSLKVNGQDMYCGFGYVAHNRSTEKAYQVAVPFHYKDQVKWNQIGYLTREGYRPKAEKVRSGRCVFIADAKMDFIKKDGSPATKYHGRRLISIPENLMESTVIDIGPYASHPVRFVELVKKYKYDEDVRYWMQYVAEKWQAPADKKAQKDAVVNYLRSIA